MKNTLRLVWVVGANGFVAWVSIIRLYAPLSSSDSRGLEVWMEVFLEILLPILGVILELLHSKFAVWVNVGYLALAGVFLAAEAAWWHSDPFFGVLLLMGMGFFLLAGITYSIYRITKTSESQA